MQGVHVRKVSQLPVVTIAKLRGRARGAGSNRPWATWKPST